MTKSNLATSQKARDLRGTHVRFDVLQKSLYRDAGESCTQRIARAKESPGTRGKR